MSDHIQNFAESAHSGSTAWLPLESNPEIFNEFAKKVGMVDSVEFVDYYGPGVLEQRAIGFLLLFPCSDAISEFREHQDAEIQQTPNYLDRSSHMCFVKQVEDFGNACGTIGCLHVCLNTQGAMDDTTPLGKFRTSASTRNPQERGMLLHQTDAFKSMSDTAAVSSDAQTSCPNRDGPDLDHHFVAFVWDPKTENIFELDGTKDGPIDHGPSSPETFEEDAWEVIQSNYFQVEPDSLEFSLMALAHKTEA
jgi:ubiquitin carboxyl-terminal hydrolase L3